MGQGAVEFETGVLDPENSQPYLTGTVEGLEEARLKEWSCGREP
jgi:hypothetical protein